MSSDSPDNKNKPGKLKKNPGLSVGGRPAETETSEPAGLIRSSVASDLSNVYRYPEAGREAGESGEKYIEKVLLKHNGNLGAQAANELIAFGQTEYLVINIRRFTSLGLDVAQKLVKKNHSEAVIRALDKFNLMPEEKRTFLKTLVCEKQGLVILNNISRFPEVDRDILLVEMIEAGDAHGAMAQLTTDTFGKWAISVLNKNRLLSGKIYDLINNPANYAGQESYEQSRRLIRQKISLFTDFDEESMLDLVNDGVFHDYKALNGFIWVSGSVVNSVNADDREHSRGNLGLPPFKSKDKDAPDAVVGINKNASPNELAWNKGMKWAELKRIHQGAGDYEGFIKMLEREMGKEAVRDGRDTKRRFEHAVLESVSQKKDMASLIQHLSFFQELSPKELAKYLITSGDGQILLDEMARFNELTLKDIFGILVSNNRLCDIEENLEMFREFFKLENLDNLIDLGLLDFYLNNRGRLNAESPEQDNELAKAVLGKNAFMLAKRLNCFADVLDKEIAYALIKKGYARETLASLDLFKDIDLDELKKVLAENDKVAAVGSGVDQISEYDNYRETGQTLADFMIAEGKVADLAKNLGNFTGLNKDTFRLLVAENARQVCRNLDSFRTLDQECAEMLIAAGKLNEVLRSKAFFRNTDWQKLLSEPARLIEQKNEAFVMENHDDYRGLSKRSIFELLRRNKHFLQIAFRPDFFDFIEHEKIAQVLLEEDQGSLLVANLAKFKNLSNQTFLELIERGFAHRIINSLGSFGQLGLAEAIQLCQNRFTNLVWLNINAFNGLTHDKIIEGVIQLDKTTAGKGRIIEDESAPKESRTDTLIKKILQNEYPYKNYSHAALAKTLLANDMKDKVIEHLANFKDLGPELFWSLFIVMRKHIAQHIGSFSGLDEQAFENLNREVGRYAESELYAKLIGSLSSFRNLGEKSYLMLEKDEHDREANFNLSSFRNLGEEIFMSIWKKKLQELLANNLESFSGLNKRWALRLAEQGFPHQVLSGLKSFEGLTGEDIKIIKKLAQSGRAAYVV